MGGRRTGRRGAAPTPVSHLVAAATLVLAWTVASSATTPVGSAPPPPYASLVVGVGVLAALVTAAEVLRTHCRAACLAAGAVAALTVLSQVLVATVGAPLSTGGRWSPEAVTVAAVGLAVLVLVTLDARLRAAAPDLVRPYAR